MKQKQMYDNTLKIYLTELLSRIGDKKVIILGNRRISGVVCCALQSLGREPDYFLNPEEDADNNGKCIPEFWGKPVYPAYAVLYEDLQNIAVINTLHYREVTDPLMYAYGLRENVNYFNLNGYQKVRRWDILDPTLGYSRTDDLAGFHIHGTLHEKQLRIVTLGGATTDYCYSYLKSWPEYLHEILIAQGIDNVVFNGGMNGYTSCEERDRMLRDVPVLKPDLVLSLSGECDIGWLMVSKKHPWYSGYYEKKIGGILRQSIQDHQREWFSLTHSELYGTEADIRDYENWIRNERIMHSVSKMYGFQYMGFLQPFIFEGNYEMSMFEAEWMKRFLETGVKEMPSLNRIFQGYRPFYEGAKKMMKSYDYLYDLTHVFDGTSGVYSDGVHYDENGNRIIANEICRILTERSFFEQGVRT